MRRPSTILAALLLLAMAKVAVGEECDPSTWFQTDLIEIQCPLDAKELTNVTIELQTSYNTAEHLKALKDKSGEFAVDVEYVAPDLEKTRIVLPKGDVQIDNPIAIAFDSDKAIKTLHLVFPPRSLFCGDELVEDEVALEITAKDEEGNPEPVVACVQPQDDEASRPWDWQINAAPADDDAQDDPGVAVDFGFEKTWGYSLHVAENSQSWSSNLWRVKLDGTGTTNDADFYDSVTADLSWSRNRAFIGEGIKGKPFTAYWLGAYVRPETTFQDDTRDYVFGARVELLANLKTLIGTDVGRGTRPYLAFGVERVDPDKREDGTVPNNYERATGDFLWKFSPFGLDRLRVETGWEAKYILDKKDLADLGLDGRLQDKLEISVGLDVTGRREFLPFLKYTRGSEAPRFDVVEEVLLGLLWNRIAPGELQQ
jgi:hypothetical protein